MAKRYLVHNTAMLGVTGRDVMQGDLLTEEEAEGLGDKRMAQLEKSGAVRVATAEEVRVGELRALAQDVADAPGETPGAVDDQTFLETIADRIEQPAREKAAEQAQGAKPAPGPESPRAQDPGRK